MHTLFRTRLSSALFVGLMILGAVPLAGCQDLSAIGTDISGAFTALTTGTPSQATTMAQAEQSYTVVINLGTVWLKSGKATKAQAEVLKSLNATAYSAIVAGRTAVANNDSAGLAVALNLVNAAVPAVVSYINKNGGGQ